MSGTLLIENDVHSLTFETTDGAVALFETNGKADMVFETVGARGPAGVGAEPYVHTQAVASSIWTVVHNRGYLADITIYDNNDEQIIGDIHHDSDNVTTITFTAPITGRARAS